MAKEKKEKKENPDRIGAGKFWAWQTRGVSAAANFIIISFVTIYCTDTLKMPPALVGTLLMITKFADGVTDLFAGFLIDRTKTRWGKGRPYEFAILGAWLCTWLLYSTPENASLAVKCVWVAVMYSLVTAVFVTLLQANQNVYFVRSFATNGQRIRNASFGGIVIMLSSVTLSIAFPVLMNRVATSPVGWSRLMAMMSVPLGLVGILRFVFVKETVQVEEDAGEKASFKDVTTLLARNPYMLMVSLMWLLYSLVTGMGIATYFFTYIVGNIELMGITQAFGMLVLPLLFFFPLMMKKIPAGKMALAGCIAYAASGIVLFAAGGNVTMVIIAMILTGIGTLPITYLTDIMMIDCGSYNAWKGRKRMDGTIGAIKGFAGKLGGGLGSGLVGFLMAAGGYDGAHETQPESALFAIRLLMGIVPAVVFALTGVMMLFYKIDKLQPEINKMVEVKTG
jgi:Na+/melibiose symporter-like transporter